jgi:septum formation protein
MAGKKTTLILASASPRRKELLARLGVKFEVLVAPITEHEDVDAEPRAMVLHNAALKAAWVCAQHPGAWVLAADTTVALDNQVLNKPADLAEARAMLKRLSGRMHTVYTGVCLWRKGSGGSRREPSLPEIAPVEISHCETSEVTFRALDDETITRYFALVNPLDKAGAYGIQEGRELILQSYRGSFSNIMGLPVEWLAGQLRGLALLPPGEPPIIEDSLFRDDSRPAAR